MNNSLTSRERRTLSRLTTPLKVQSFLDELRYNPQEGWFRCPLQVLRDRKGHCFEGAVFAAAVMEKLGYPPLIVNMFPEPGTDDEHLVAVFRRRGTWGAVGKSNYVGLRYREPIYRNLRELVMSYFEQYYNVKKQKTLRFYTRALDLRTFERHQWRTSNETMNRIDRRLDALKRIPVLNRSQIRALSLVDERSYRAGLSGSNPEGLFAP